MAKGQNVWFDLMTNDMDAATRFYTEALGWKTQKWENADPEKPYLMWVADEPMGGVTLLPEMAKKMNVPPHWIAYTVVDDVDATVKMAESLGGRAHAPAYDIPEVGRIAMLADPQGASFAVIKPQDPMKVKADKPGQFSWAELNTTDWEGAWKFYAQLFDWKEKSTMDMGPGGTYYMWTDKADQTKGGMLNAAKMMDMPPHWLHYVTVDDIDAAVERVKQNGGKILNGPMDIPGGDKIAQCLDPQGAAFAVYAEGSK